MIRSRQRRRHGCRRSCKARTGSGNGYELCELVGSSLRRPYNLKRRAPSAERRAPSAERRAPSAERRAPSAEAMTAPRAPEHHRRPSPPDRLPSPRGGHPSSQTASAAARPAGFARLPLARRVLVRLRPVARRGAARAHRRPRSPGDGRGADRHHPGQHRQSGSSQLRTAEDQMVLDGGSVDHNGQQVGQEFTTGMNEDGYTLTGVDIVSASSTGFTAKVCDALSDSATSAGISRILAALGWERCPSPSRRVPRTRSRKPRPMRWC